MYLIWQRDSTVKGAKQNTSPNAIRLQYRKLVCLVPSGLCNAPEMVETCQTNTKWTAEWNLLGMFRWYCLFIDDKPRDHIPYWKLQVWNVGCTYAVFKILLNTYVTLSPEKKLQVIQRRYKIKKMVRTLQCNSSVTLLWPMQLLKIYVKKKPLHYFIEKNKDFMWRPLWSEEG